MTASLHPASDPCLGQGRQTLFPLLFALLAGGCSSERRAYQQAALLHGPSIAHIAAFAPFLRAPAAGGGAAWRHGALVARAEIAQRAAAARDHDAVPGAPRTPTTRVAHALSDLLPACGIGPGEDAQQERRRAQDCAEGIRRANAALALEAARGAQRGVPERLLPRITPAYINEEARAAAASLERRLRPSPAELERRRLWLVPDVAPALLLRACDAALREAQGAVPGVAEEIERPCTALRQGERLLGDNAACGDGGARCGGSLCGMLAVGAGSEDLPPSYRRRLREAAERCEQRQTSQSGELIDEEPRRRRRH